MTIYFLLFFLLLFASSQNKKKWYFLSFVCLLTIAALRNISVGTDTQFYLERFDIVDENTDLLDNILTNKSEYFESFLYIIAHKLGLDFQFVLGIEAFIFLGLCFWFYEKNLNNPSAGVFLLYSLGLYFALFNGARQLISVAVCLFTYYFLEDKPTKLFKVRNKGKSFFIERFNDIMFFLIVVVASFIHQSSLIILLLFPLKYLRLNGGLLFIILLLFFVFGISGDWGSVVESLVGYVWRGERFGSYIHYNASYIGLSNIINILILYAIYKIYRKDLDLDNNIYFKASVLELAIILLFSSSIAYMPRVVMPFTIASSVLYAQCLSQKNKNGKVLMALVIMKVFAITMLSGANGTIPYKFYWE